MVILNCVINPGFTCVPNREGDLYRSQIDCGPLVHDLYTSYLSKKCFVRASTDISAYVSLVLRHGQAFSPIYRFSLSDGTIVSAHTKSKLVRSPATNEPQLYMSLHILQRYVSLPTPVSGIERGKPAA